MNKSIRTNISDEAYKSLAYSFKDTEVNSTICDICNKGEVIAFRNKTHYCEECYLKRGSKVWLVKRD